MNMFILLPEIITCMHVCQDKYCMSPIHTVKIKCIAIKRDESDDQPQVCSYVCALSGYELDTSELNLQIHGHMLKQVSEILEVCLPGDVTLLSSPVPEEHHTLHKGCIFPSLSKNYIPECRSQKQES